MTNATPLTEIGIRRTWRRLCACRVCLARSNSFVRAFGLGLWFEMSTCRRWRALHH